jgi:hypothetical protein
MKILKLIIEFLRKFFSSKIGKVVAAGAGTVGAAGVVAGGVQVHKAKKRNRLAEHIKDSAIKRIDESKAETEKVLNELGNIEIAVLESFSSLADTVEKIRQRPEIHTEIEGIALPAYDPVAHKKLASEVEVAIVGAGGAVAGTAIGIAAMGVGVLAMGPGILAAGIVICVSGTKMAKRSAENLKQAKQIDKDSKVITAYYEELRLAAKQYRQSLSSVKAQFDKHLKSLQKIVAKKTDWNLFTVKERLITKNAITLACLLDKMCRIKLVVKSDQLESMETVNKAAIDRTIADANNTLVAVKNSVT